MEDGKVNGTARRGWRTELRTRMEDGNVYVVVGAHRVKPCITTT